MNSNSSSTTCTSPAHRAHPERRTDLGRRDPAAGASPPRVHSRGRPPCREVVGGGSVGMDGRTGLASGRRTFGPPGELSI
jgi:hypothetical protein